MMARTAQTPATVNAPNDDTETSKEETETTQQGKLKHKKTLPLELVAQQQMGFATPTTYS